MCTKNKSKETGILKQLKSCFEEILPTKKDGRTKIPALEFMVSLIFSFLGDTKSSSLESMRRALIQQTKCIIARSSFWDRLASNQTKKLLRNLLENIMAKFVCQKCLFSDQILATLKVKGILLIDSCSFSLWDGAKNSFPGTRTTAGIKWHLGFDPLTGFVKWFDITPTSTHDRKCFPDLSTLVGQLIIMDLGYWDYGLLLAIQDAKAFFLCRIKSTATLTIKKVVSGLPKKYVGEILLSIAFKRKRDDILEVIVHKIYKGIELECRAFGFWNPEEKIYQWYISNLSTSIPACLIYPLYRFRWQIELIFKACKQSLNAARLSSNDSNIIESLVLASITAHMSSQTIFHIALPGLTKDQRLAISFQRIAKVTVHLANEFIQFLFGSSDKYLQALIDSIHIFIHEIFDPNYKKRDSSLRRIDNLLNNL